MYKIFIWNRSAHTACSAVVSPCAPPGSGALGQLPTPWVYPLASIRLSLRIRAQNATEKTTEARNPSSPRGAQGPFHPTSHQQAQTLAGVGFCATLSHHPKPRREGGKAAVLLWQRGFPYSERKGMEKKEKKRNVSLFHLENPCSVSVWWLGKVLLGSRGRGDEKIYWVLLM